MPATLLKTKLYIPPTRPQLVERPHLIEQLTGSVHKKLTLISAPPGFGKTTLVSAWIDQNKNGNNHTPLRVAWVSLDEFDNDPIRFWTYTISALDTVQTGIGSNAMALLQEPQAPPIEETLTALINATTDLPEKITLVFDDYHIIEAESIHQALTFFIDHLPQQIHLIITSRSDPPLPLTRLRVRGQLTELRDSDLRFSPGEAAIFLNQVMGIDIGPNELAALETRTEGWIAGLQLAALSMQGHNDTQNFVRAFTGSHRYIIDYLAEEVLNQQPEHIRTFLLKTAILDRLNGPLCDTLLGYTQPISQDTLEQLEQANLFLIPLDGSRRWYRYHHLFADFLRETLHQEASENELTTLHQQASRWYADNGLTEQAVSHAITAKNNDEAVRLIESVLIEMITAGEVTAIIKWLDALPPETVINRPRLSLGKGWALLITGQWDKVEPYLEAAETGLLNMEKAGTKKNGELIQSLRAETLAMRAMIVGGRQDSYEEAIKLCEQALEQLSPENALGRSIIIMTLGNAYEAMGQIDKAITVLEEAIAISKPTNYTVITLSSLGNLARIQEEKGNLYQAAKIYQQSIEYTEQISQERGQIFPGARWGHVELAEIYREWNNLEKAKQHLTIALEMKHQINMLGGNLGVAHLILARILQADGDSGGALDALQDARQRLPENAMVKHWGDAVQARVWLSQGNIFEAAQWAQTYNLWLNGQEEHPYFLRQLKFPGEFSTLVRIYIAQERFDEAETMLNVLQIGAENAGKTGRLVDIVMLQALVNYAQGNRETALKRLAEALNLGESGGYMRTFIDEGKPMADMLRLVKQRKLAVNTTYVDTLLAGIEGTPATAPTETLTAHVPHPAIANQSVKNQDLLVEPLSDREIEVLQLVAEGLSNREIAEQLFITVGTAKTHTINIYRKLDVRSRTQAVARAQELGLF